MKNYFSFIAICFVAMMLFTLSSFAGKSSHPLIPREPKPERIEPTQTSEISQAHLPRKPSPHSDSPKDLQWVLMDSMPNAYGPAHANINPLAYDPWNNHIAMIYRGALNYQPPNLTTGSLWYGSSHDEFTTWARVGKLNADIDQYGRYPSCAISNPNHSSTPADAIFMYSFPHLCSGSAFGCIGFGLEPFLQNTPFNVMSLDNSYGSSTYIWTSDNHPSAYFLVPKSDSLCFWGTVNQGETWNENACWLDWTDIYGERGQSKGDTTYVEAVVEDTSVADYIFFKINKSTNNGTTWSGWENVLWKTIPQLSEYDNLGSLDFSIAHDFVVDAYGYEHIFFNVVDTNVAPNRLHIVEAYRTVNGWSGNIVAQRTLSFIPGFAALSQMDNELQAAISEDRRTIVVKWVDAPVEGETDGDIFATGKRIGWGDWTFSSNLTQTSGSDGREMFTHLAPRFENSPLGFEVTVYLTKTEQLAIVPDPMLDDTQPCALWGAKACVPFIIDLYVTEREPGKPPKFKLYSNYPNPFNAQTIIPYDIPTASVVSLKVFDVNGREVVNLYHGYQEAGQYKATYNASHLASGVYFYRLNVQQSNNVIFSASEKMVVTK
ncbi:MAG: T9SS type A sorting domain-containing protein [Ignavibacteriales bacterium]|nr:T9SS type A sorting domain-containing protein [Ignavibacteriales bacterium]